MYEALNTANEDHLHTRGEYKKPRMRVGAIVGITSTHVENTLVRCFEPLAWWDHLHTRGEYVTG